MENQESSKPMDERELLAILKAEESDASQYYSSELAQDQAEAMERYNARPYGDEVENRSQIVTHDIENTINWMMPHLMRLFRTDDLIAIEDDTIESDKERDDCITGYLNHIFFKDNDGKTVIYDFTFDGALQRKGVVRVAWEDPSPSPPKLIEGVLPEQLEKYTLDDEYEIKAQSSEVRSIDGQPIEVFDLEVVHTPKMGRVVIETVAPEQFAISRRAKSIEEGDYHRHKEEEFAANIMRMFPDKAKDIDLEGLSSRGQNDQIDDLDSDPRRQARFDDENYDQHSNETHHQRRRKVDLITEYLRIDYDGDNVVELRQIKRVGNVILENLIVDKSEFIDWSPIRVSHKSTGRSLADTILDIQKIRTVITRKMLDSLSQSLAPRRIGNSDALGEDGMDALLDHDIGDVIPCEGDPNQAVAELITPDVSASAHAALEYFDTMSEEASGVTRHAQGLKAEAITDTKGGIENLQAAANARIELVGEWLGHAVEKIFQRSFDLICAHQDHPRMIKINGKPTPVDARTWSDESRVTLHIGQAAETREAKLAKLGLIAQKQEQILMEVGPNNPLVTMRQYGETLGLMAREAGFRDPERFFSAVPEDWQPPEQPEDPKVAEAKGKLQLAQAEAQSKQQLAQAQAQQSAQQDQMRMQFEQQMNTAKLQNDQEVAGLKFQHEQQLDVARMESEREIAAMRIQSEKDIAFARMEAEMDLARWRASQEMDLAKSKAASETKITTGNRPGGSLAN